MQPINVRELRAPAEVQPQSLERNQPREALQPIHILELRAAVEVQRQLLERAQPRRLARRHAAALEIVADEDSLEEGEEDDGF